MLLAYTAALRVATLALAVDGFRASREQYHYRVLQSLAYTVNLDPVIIDELDKLRKKRNIGIYDCTEIASDYEADRMVELAVLLRNRVVMWLKEMHPELIE